MQKCFVILQAMFKEKKLIKNLFQSLNLPSKNNTITVDKEIPQLYIRRNIVEEIFYNVDDPKTFKDIDKKIEVKGENNNKNGAVERTIRLKKVGNDGNPAPQSEPQKLQLIEANDNFHIMNIEED